MENPLSTTSDEDLLARARTGNQQAFRLLVERHKDAVARTVVAMLGQSDEVDDVVQEVFIRFYHALEQFRGDARVSTYIKRIAINKTLDALRRRKRFFERFVRHDHETFLLVDKEGQDHMETQERTQLVHKAIASLPPRHRAVVVLRLIEGYSTNETAEILKIPYGTVLSRLSRAMDRLRENLQSVVQDVTQP